MNKYGKGRHTRPLKSNAKIAADNTDFFFKFYPSMKIRLDVSCEASAGQKIRMKYKVKFFLKTLEKYSRLSSAVVMIGPLRIKEMLNPKSINKSTSGPAMSNKPLYLHLLSFCLVCLWQRSYDL